MNKEPPQSLESQLADAEAALTQWEQYDLVREDGSLAQDRRHVETGEWRRKEVERLSNEVIRQNK